MRSKREVLANLLINGKFTEKAYYFQTYDHDFEEGDLLIVSDGINKALASFKTYSVLEGNAYAHVVMKLADDTSSMLLQQELEGTK